MTKWEQTNNKKGEQYSYMISEWSQHTWLYLIRRSHTLAHLVVSSIELWIGLFSIVKKRAKEWTKQRCAEPWVTIQRNFYKNAMMSLNDATWPISAHFALSSKLKVLAARNKMHCKFSSEQR